MTWSRTLLFSWLAVALPAATIRIDPASASGPVGGITDLNFSIADVADLYAYQFDLAFDAAVLSASPVTEGAFLSGGGATFFIPGTIDNTAGTITFTVNTLLGPTPGVSGTGALAGIREEGQTEPRRSALLRRLSAILDWHVRSESVRGPAAV